jgi:hypothetical protein
VSPLNVMFALGVVAGIGLGVVVAMVVYAARDSIRARRELAYGDEGLWTERGQPDLIGATLDHIRSTH